MRRRSSLYLGGGAVVILAVGCFFFEQALLGFPKPQPANAPTGKVLSPVNLASDERIVIDYRITRGTDSDHWIFQLTAAPDRRLAVIDAGDGWGGDRLSTGKPKAIGALMLSDNDCRGLQGFFELFRKSDHQAASTAKTELRLEYFQGPTKIGEEAFLENDLVEHRIMQDDDDVLDSNRSAKVISLRQLAIRARAEADGG